MLKTLNKANSELLGPNLFFIVYVLFILLSSSTILFQLMESLNERLYEHPNFVWLDQVSFKKYVQCTPKYPMLPWQVLPLLCGGIPKV